HERSVVHACPDLLRDQLHASGVQSLEDVVDTRVVLFGLILLNNGRVDCIIIEPTPIVLMKSVIRQVFEPGFDTPEPKFPATTPEHTSTEILQGFESLLPIDDE